MKIINFFKKEKLPEDLRDNLKPSPEFARRAEFLFLTAWKQKFWAVTVPAVFKFKYFLSGAAAGVAFMVFISGAAVYADQKNVGPESLLYPLKRSSESVNLALTPVEEKPVLQMKIAQRRLDEIEKLKAVNPQSQKIAVLADEFKKQAEESFSTIKNGEDKDLEEEKTEKKEKEKDEDEPEIEKKKFLAPSKGNLAESAQPARELSKRESIICQSFGEILKSGSKEVEQMIKTNPKILSKFQKKCLASQIEKED